MTDTTARWAGDRSPRSLAIVLANAAERVRTDPEANFTDGAVRGAAEVLTGRLVDRLATAGGQMAEGRDDVERS